MAHLTLVEARKLLGWNQSRLAAESGLKISAIYDIEAGRNQSPGYNVVMQIINALKAGGLEGITPEDVFPVPAPQAQKASR